MNLFEELDREPPRRQTAPRMSRAQKEKLALKQAQQRMILEDARANGVIVDSVEQLLCSAPCPTVLAYPYETAGLCAGCRLALGRAGIVLDA